jgi:hypothetical protein
MFIRFIGYLVLGMYLFLGPQFNYSLSGMITHMREKALAKASEPWPEPCFDWSNTRMPINEQKQWKKEYKECQYRNRVKFKN